MTNETPVVKLGDVRQWLKPGDTIDLGTGPVFIRFLEDRCALVQREEHGGLVRYSDTSEVRLISPRWERLKPGESTNTGDVLCDEEGVAWERTTSHAVPVLETETIYRLVRTRLATRKGLGLLLPRELEVGDMFQRPEEPRVTWLATGVDDTRIAMRCVSSSAPGISVGYIGSQGREDWQKLTLLSCGNDVGTVKCVRCEQPEHAGRPLRPYANGHWCGDCMHGNPGGIDAWIRYAPTAQPAPSPSLTPSARYHLNDDADAFGIPEYS